MGGHGGLNILPQKRWNVYNHDAREKVERDVKKHEEKEREERIRQEQDEADVRYEVLKARKQQRAREEHRDNEEKPKSYLNDELKTLMPEHFNLFKKEEDAQRKEMRQQKNEEYEKEKKMKEDRFVEQTTCYLGQTVKKSTPWYCQSAPTEESIANQKTENRWGKPRGRDKERHDRRQKGNNQPNSVFKVPEDNYFQVLDLDLIKDKKVSSKQEIKEEKDKELKEKERDDSAEKDKRAREKSRDKEKKKKDKKDKKEKKDKKDKKHKKHKKNKSERKMSAESSVSRSRSRSKSQEKENDKEKERQEERLKQAKLARLRAERVKREQAEKKKAEKLIKETFPLGKGNNADSFYYFN